MKKYEKKSLKTSTGITLIALVITIIVLLILAGISISMLSGDNSILYKSTDAKQTSERAEAKEQAQIDIMAYIADKTANHQDASLDDTKVKVILTGKSYVKDGQPGNESFITAKGEYEIPYSELYTASNKTPVVSMTGINYGSKTAETIEINEDITIGTEKFKVLKNDGTAITAVPYYNITLTDEPIQSPSAGTISFSDIQYWLSSNFEPEMDDVNNNIQPYIKAYNTTLIKLGATNVTTRIMTVTKDIAFDGMNLNPSKTGRYWIGTTFSLGNDIGVNGVDENGYWQDSIDIYNRSEYVGVRPIIEITI